MSKELSNTQDKIITDKLIDSIQQNLVADKDLPPQTAVNAVNFWEENRHILVGMGIEVLKNILNIAKDKKTLTETYKKALAGMTWEERNLMLRVAAGEVIKEKNKYVNATFFIGKLIDLSIKLLPIILMAL